MVRVMGTVMGRVTWTETGILIPMGMVRRVWTRIRSGAVRGLVRGAGTGALRKTVTGVQMEALGVAGMETLMGAGIVVLRGTLTRAWRGTGRMTGRVGGECQDFHLRF